MVLSLLNQLEEEREEKQPEVYGCSNCGLIYDPRVYFWGEERGDLGACCPRCSSKGTVKLLGPLPFIVEKDDEHFLYNEEVFIGPFPTAVDAHNSLWEWFNKKEGTHGKEKSCKEKGIIKRGSLRLINESSKDDKERPDEQGES